MVSRLSNIAKVISLRKKDTLIILLWGLILGLIVIEVYWVGYREIRWLQFYRVAYGWYETPTPKLLDLLLVLIASIGFGALVSNAKVLFYGYISGLLLAFFTSFVFVMYYMWAVLRLEVLFNWANFDWEWAVFFAVLNVGKIMFPQVVFLSLLGVVVGCFLRERFSY